jgi:hypothetical protein
LLEVHLVSQDLTTDISTVRHYFGQNLTSSVRMLNKLDLKNYDKVVASFDFDELVRVEPISDVAHTVYNKVSKPTVFPDTPNSQHVLTLFL